MFKPHAPAADDVVMSPRYVTLVPLAYTCADDGYVVGSISDGEFVELPEVAALILRALQLGHDIETVERLVEAELGERTDIRDFLEQVDELGWIVAVGDQPPAPPETPETYAASRLVRALFSRPAWSVYVGCAALDAVLLASGMAPFPSVPALIDMSTPFVMLVTMFVIGTVTLVVHEAWHCFAGPGGRSGLHVRDQPAMAHARRAHGPVAHVAAAPARAVWTAPCRVGDRCGPACRVPARAGGRMGPTGDRLSQ